MGHPHLISDLPFDVIIGDGSRSFTNRVQGIDPLNAQDLATKTYVDSIAGGDADQIQGRDVATDAPADGYMLVWSASRSEWVPTLNGSDASGDGLHGVDIDDGWEGSVYANAWGLFVATAEGNEPNLLADNTAYAGGTGTTSIQRLAHLPNNYTPGDALLVRFRARYTTAALVSTEIDAAAYAPAGKVLAGSDIVTTAARALTSAWQDYEFSLNVADLGPGDPIVIVLRFVTDDTAGANNAKAEVGAVWLGIGALVWQVGAGALVGSSEVE